MKRKVTLIIILVLALAFIFVWELKKEETISPEELAKLDFIHLKIPRANDVVKSPLEVSGEARGVWFFEASFPVIVTNWDGLITGQGFATAQGEWMTEDFVPFTATIQFKNPPAPEGKNNGSLILKKDNPSGLPEHDDALEIPIIFSD